MKEIYKKAVNKYFNREYMRTYDSLEKETIDVSSSYKNYKDLKKKKDDILSFSNETKDKRIAIILTSLLKKEHLISISSIKENIDNLDTLNEDDIIKSISCQMFLTNYRVKEENIKKEHIDVIFPFLINCFNEEVCPKEKIKECLLITISNEFNDEKDICNNEVLSILDIISDISEGFLDWNFC